MSWTYDVGWVQNHSQPRSTQGGPVMSSVTNHKKAMVPEELTRLFVERSNAGDVDGVAELYEHDAVMAYPPGQFTVGREAIRELWAGVLSHRPQFKPEAPLPTLISGDIALTSTPPSDGAGARAQVVRRQPDGSWLRLLDQPEFITPPVSD
jgi:uncharacterized protein (TIGR02246 family)